MSDIPREEKILTRITVCIVSTLIVLFIIAEFLNHWGILDNTQIIIVGGFLSSMMMLVIIVFAAHLYRKDESPEEQYRQFLKEKEGK